jgi:hypothetical protein
MKFSIFVLLILLFYQIHSQQHFLNLVPSSNLKTSSLFSIITGSTKTTDWTLYAYAAAITVYVDLSQYKLTKAPYVYTSLNGNGMHYATIGATSIYELSPSGFRVYVGWWNGSPITINDAQKYGW